MLGNGRPANWESLGDFMDWRRPFSYPLKNGQSGRITQRD
jgi:hypothetical protein